MGPGGATSLYAPRNVSTKSRAGSAPRDTVVLQPQGGDTPARKPCPGEARALLAAGPPVRPDLDGRTVARPVPHCDPGPALKLLGATVGLVSCC